MSRGAIDRGRVPDFPSVGSRIFLTAPSVIRHPVMRDLRRDIRRCTTQSVVFLLRRLDYGVFIIGFLMGILNWINKLV